MCCRQLAVRVSVWRWLSQCCRRQLSVCLSVCLSLYFWIWLSQMFNDSRLSGYGYPTSLRVVIITDVQLQLCSKQPVILAAAVCLDFLTAGYLWAVWVAIGVGYLSLFQLGVCAWLGITVGYLWLEQVGVCVWLSQFSVCVWGGVSLECGCIGCLDVVLALDCLALTDASGCLTAGFVQLCYTQLYTSVWS